MKLQKQLLIKADASYLELTLTSVERNWFVTSPQFKQLLSQTESNANLFSSPADHTAKFILGDLDAKEENVLYIKVKDSWKSGNYTISALQQVLLQLLQNSIISIDAANRLVESACTTLLLPIMRFIQQGDSFVVSKQETNLTQIVLGKVKKDQEFKHLTSQQRQEIENWINPYFAALEELEPVTTIKILDEMDRSEIFNSQFRENQAIYSKISNVHDILEYPEKTFLNLPKESRYDCTQYLHKLLSKKILQIGIDTDVIASAFAVDTKPEHIIDLMNLLTRSTSKYREEHAKALSYLLTHKNISPRQALNEIININSYQAQSLVKLYDYGLRGNHLRAYQRDEEKDAYFGYDQRDALSYFIQEKQFSPDKAIAEINGLSREQIEALMKLFDAGLRGEHLRAWNAGELANFNDTQAETLEYLIVKQKVNPANAIQEINQLTWPCCEALQNLYEHGLRGSHLRSLLPNFSVWQVTEDHMNALISLVREHKVPTDIAVAEIRQLDGNRGRWYATALKELYGEGLRSKHLLKYQSTRSDDNFTSEHCAALVSLIKEQHLTPAAAVSEISYLSDYAASAVGKLYAQGLRGADLRHWKNDTARFDDDDHYALLNLAKKHKELPMHNILEILCKMSAYDIYDMAKDWRSEPPASTAMSMRR